MSTTIPYDMMDLAASAEQARRAARLQTIYHKGQEHIWDGREVLEALIEEHGGVQASPAVRRALGHLFTTILWGELAAWRVSSQLADAIGPLDAKMAATSQAHDEARHFYVMSDYLQALGYQPEPLHPHSEAFLGAVIREKDLTLKLLGMQLMVEAIAVAIFGAVRRTGVEPVLCDLLRYYEKDEARHIGLGVQYLPELLQGVSRLRRTKLVAYDLRLIFLGLRALRVVEEDLAVLGISARELHYIAKKKHMQCFEEMWEVLGEGAPPGARFVERLADSVADAWFPPKALQGTIVGRCLAFADVWRTGDAAPVH